MRIQIAAAMTLAMVAASGCGGGTSSSVAKPANYCDATKAVVLPADFKNQNLENLTPAQKNAERGQLDQMIVELRNVDALAPAEIRDAVHAFVSFYDGFVKVSIDTNYKTDKEGQDATKAYAAAHEATALKLGDDYKMIVSYSQAHCGPLPAWLVDTSTSTSTSTSTTSSTDGSAQTTTSTVADSGPTTTTQQASGQRVACQLLTHNDVVQLLVPSGAKVDPGKPQNGDSKTCLYTWNADSGGTILASDVTLSLKTDTSKDNFDFDKASATSPQPVAGLGDEAYVETKDNFTTIHVLRGTLSFDIGSGNVGSGSSPDALKKAAQLVLSRL